MPIGKPAALAALLTLGLLSPALADDDRHLTVSAEGMVLTTPDRATISLGINAQADTAQEAMTKAATVQSDVIGSLREAGIEGRDLQTTSITLSPVRNYYEKKAPKVTGYEAANIITIRVRDLTKLGAILDKAVAQGANDLRDVRLEREDIADLEDQARADAVAKARHRAEILSAAAGVSLGRVLSISEGGETTRAPAMMMRAVAADAAESASTPVEAGEIAVQSHVTMVFELK